MDDQVLGAMQKWPNVPAVYGWLSLNAQGDWLMYTEGGARDGQNGEKIANEQIRLFMNRNYAATKKGEWFFQNGPQRVFVDLACAPFIARLTDDAQTLITHNGLPVTRITQWFLNQQGQLYLHCEHGAAMITGRDMALITPRLRVATASGSPETLDQRHLDELDRGKTLQMSLDGVAASTAPLQGMDDAQLPSQLGFVRQPVAT